MLGICPFNATWMRSSEAQWNLGLSTDAPFLISSGPVSLVVKVNVVVEPLHQLIDDDVQLLAPEKWNVSLPERWARACRRSPSPL